MKRCFFLFLLLAAILACNFNITTLPPPALTPTTANNTSTVATLATPTTISGAAEETEIRDLVENFGKRLRMVSLLVPNATQQIQEQYSEFVSPTLLETWMNDLSKAPGRMVSSPWPDRIEITTLTKESPGRYVVTGVIVEITSVEMTNGGAADRIPVHMVVEGERGHWLITEYSEEQFSAKAE